MTYDLVIKNGTIVTAETTYRADIGITGERIAAVGEDLAGAAAIDATGKLVTPGAIDVHVHLQMPIGDFVSADDFFTGTRAAAFGGTTTVIDFVEAEPAESMLDALAARRAEADPRVVIDYGLHMTIGPDEMDKLDQAPAAAKAGCASFKLYMAYGFRLDDGQLLRALEATREAGALPIVHAENWDVICTLIERNLAAGPNPAGTPAAAPPLRKERPPARVIDLATLAETPLYVFHVSCGQVVDRIAAARSRGLPIYGETCPQYLFLSDELFETAGVAGALPVCSPPIRTEAHQARLWQALARNNLQVVSTDHCPFTRADKSTGLGDYSRIPGGVPSIEARFPLIYFVGVSGGRFSANRWVDMCCTTPARLFGLAQKGHIAVGYDADLVVFDPEIRQTLSTETLHENVDWTLYDGIEVTGWPAVTISRGAVVVEDGEFRGRAGQGRFVARRINVSV